MPSWRAIAGTVFDPVATFRGLAESPRSMLVLLVLIAANLTVPLALNGRLDARAVTIQEQGPKLADMTDRELADAVAQKEKLTVVLQATQAVFGPPVLAFELTLLLWLFGRYLRGKPGFGALYSLAAHAQIPLALRSLARSAVILTRQKLEPGDVDHLLTSSLAPLAHAPALARALSGADLFLLWTAGLLGIALYAAGKLPPLRVALGMAVIYAAFVAVFLVSLPAMTGGA